MPTLSPESPVASSTRVAVKPCSASHAFAASTYGSTPPNAQRTRVSAWLLLEASSTARTTSRSVQVSPGETGMARDPSPEYRR